MDAVPFGSCIELAMDTRTPEQRSQIMRSVRSRDTGPELVVRRMLHGLGLRFRLHRKDLAGRPDIVLPGRKAVVFVHGCFWHGHGCSKGQLPKSSIRFWTDKISRNRERDSESVKALRAGGWRVLTVWQCETKHSARLCSKLARFFRPKSRSKATSKFQL
jgi:DNA mismatch endonuclease, patch repair protein